MLTLLRLLRLLVRSDRALRRFVLASIAVAADVQQYLVGLATRDERRSQHCFVGGSTGRRFKMLLSRPGHIEDALVREGTWEPHVCSALDFFVGERGVFVDVGANIGFHSLHVASAFPGTRVIAFEPNPTVAADLRRNLAFNGFANVEVRQLAVGQAGGVAPLYAQRPGAYNRGNAPTSSVCRNIHRRQCEAALLH